VIVAPCGFDLARTRGEMHWLTERPDFARLKAVQTGRLFLADGNRFFNRPGPRVAETLRMIEQMIGTASMATHCDPEQWAVYSRQAQPVYGRQHF
jgi:iron complex transport system substrate-binding protein